MCKTNQLPLLRSVHLSFLACVLLAAPASAENLQVFDRVRIDNETREVRRTLAVPEYGPTTRMIADIAVHADQDPWDKAGSFYLVTPEGDRVEIVKFVTGFKGNTQHQCDVTDLAPFLKPGAEVEFGGFIDTWVEDGWRFSAALRFEDAESRHPDWAHAVVPMDDDWRSTEPRSFKVVVPGKMSRVWLTYLVSGHHHEDNGNSDEFHQRRHHIAVDGREVWTGVPWRTDGHQYRHLNPTSGRWDGNGDGDTDDPYPVDRWSSDFPRSNWVPGQDVEPIRIDLSEPLGGAGEHTLTIRIDDIGKDSFWRVSAYLSGVAAPR